MNHPQVDFRPFVSVNAGYSTGLAGVGVTENGDIPSYDAYTAGISWGVSGSHSWRRTLVGLDYRGSLSHYVHQGSFDNMSHSLLLGVTHQLTRHITLSLNQSGGMFSRYSAFRGLQQTVPFDPSTVYTPTQDYFDNRTYYLSSQAYLTIQRSTRLSFAFGGGYNRVDYRSNALRASRGYNATADVAYRLTRRTTIGAAYQYGHFGFKGIFGGSDLHGGVLTFGRTLTKTLELSGYGGFARVETTFLRTVPLDPVVVALLGISTGTEVGHTVTYIPNYAVRLARNFQTGVLSFSVGHSVVPGNGLFLTSYSTRYNAQYTYTGLRRWSFGWFVQFAQNKAAADITGDYRTGTSGLSVSRTITGNLHFVSTASARRYLSHDFHNYNRTITDVTIGIGYTPGDIPLRVW